MAPSSKKYLTYSKHVSQLNSSARFEELNQRTPQNIRSSLSTPTSSPRRSPSLSARPNKPIRDSDVFDIPSSDEEYRRRSRILSTKKHALPTDKVTAVNNNMSARQLNVSVGDPKQPDLLHKHPKKKRKTHHESSNSTSAPKVNLLGQLAKQNLASDPERSTFSFLSSKSAPNQDSHLAGPTDIVQPVVADVWDTLSSDSDSQTTSRKLTTHRYLSVPPEAKHEIWHEDPKASIRGIAGSLPSTPKRLQSEPFDPLYNDSPRSVSQSGDTPSAKGISTPKQENLWDKLLFHQTTAVATPSHHVQLLNLGRTGELDSTTDPSRAIPRNKGLVDALKPAAQQSSPIDDPTSDGASHRHHREEDFRRKGNSDDHDHEMTSPSKITLAYERQESDAHRNTKEDPASTSHRLTYGGQRSYLEDSEGHLENLLDQPLDIEASLEMPLLDLNIPKPTQPVNDKARAKVESVDVMEDEASGVKTIFDLKAAGVMEHFTDEMNEIIDDLNDGKAALSRKRMAMLDLHRKLSKPAFRTRLINSAYPPLIFKKCSAEFDVIFGTVAAGSLNLLLGPPGDSYNPSQLHQSGCLSFLTRLLDEPRDIKKAIKDRQYNLSRAAQDSVEIFQKDVMSNSFWKESGLMILSPRTLGLITIETFIRRLRGQGNVDPLLNPKMLAKLLDILELSLKTVDDESVNTLSKENLAELETVLSTLETCTTNAACALDVVTWTESSMKRLVKVLESVIMFEHQSIQRLIARLSLNLANSIEDNARMFASESFVGSMIARIVREFEMLHVNQNSAHDLDVLLLSLGAMLNLAECSEQIRQQVAGNDFEQLETLVNVFLLGRKQAASADSLAAVQVNVAYGWLSVLLGNLCQSKNIRQHIAKLLPGSGLKSLIDAVDEFISHHKEADKTEDGNESYAMFTQRLQGVAAILRAVND